MKRFFMLALVVGLVLAGTFVWQAAVNAQESPPMTEAHIEQIRRNCVEAQSSLNQVHASDGLLRYNRGQLYESISTKLMAPFNSRVAANRLDSVNLPAIASQYEKELTAFRLNYQQYEETMSKTLRINCTDQPVAFYDSLASARTKRAAVHASTVTLHKLIHAYKVEFEVFAQKFQEGVL